MLFLTVLIVAIFLVSMKRSLFIVPNSKLVVVERMGKFRAVLAPGFHILLPFADRVVREFDSSGESVRLPDQLLSNGTRSVWISGILNYRVTDAGAAAYEVEDIAFALLTSSAAILPELLEESPELTANSLARTFEDPLKAALQKCSKRWGVEILEVKLEGRRAEDASA